MFIALKILQYMLCFLDPLGPEFHLPCTSTDHTPGGVHPGSAKKSALFFSPPMWNRYEIVVNCIVHFSNVSSW